MKIQFAKYEIALALKELGFNEECCKFYNNDKSLSDFLEDKDLIYFINSKCNDVFSCSAPLWQQVIDFFREKYNIYINIIPVTFDSEPTYIYEIIDLKSGKLLNEVNASFVDSHEAREQTILKAIEICKKEK